MTNERVRVGDLGISKVLFDFVNRDVIPGTEINAFTFWSGFGTILKEFSAENRKLLEKRDYLQAKIDHWHQTHPGVNYDREEYKKFLYEIGYLTPRNPDDRFQIGTTNVDEEIAIKAGPQLVVPLMNARFTLNAANARWGSLYDALYGTDVIPETDGCEKTKGYNAKRGDKVIAFARRFLDEAVPLAGNCSHRDAINYAIESNELKVIPT